MSSARDGRRTGARIRRGLAAGATVGVLALAACSAPTISSAAPAPAASYAAAPCPNPIYPGVAQLDLGAGVECGYLTVPENRSAPNGRTLRLAVARAEATAPNPKPDPLVYLSGGPGGSGLPSAAQRIAAAGTATATSSSWTNAAPGSPIPCCPARRSTPSSPTGSA
jgi:hypothetical protein